MAGNVVPLLADGTEAHAITQLAHRLAPGGLLVVNVHDERIFSIGLPAGGLLDAGFGLDAAHLPHGATAIALDDYDIWCAAAGLVPAARWATWDQHTFTDDAGYAVGVHRR